MASGPGDRQVWQSTKGRIAFSKNLEHLVWALDEALKSIQLIYLPVMIQKQTNKKATLKLIKRRR